MSVTEKPDTEIALVRAVRAYGVSSERIEP